MKKSKIKTKDNVTPIQKKSLKDFISLDLAICLLITILLFLPTINRPWLVYDERILFDGLYFPQLINFKEFFEVISNFGLDFNVISSNSMYSSNYVRRTCPLSQVLGIIVTFFLKKDPIRFHI